MALPLQCGGAVASLTAAQCQFSMLFFPDFDLAAHERPRVVHIAEAALGTEPRALTSARNPRSAGGAHDFSSEGDYWWPDPANPNGPYIRKDGLTNPDNFTAHRQLMFGLAREVGALAAAYDLTGEERFAAAALRHLRRWFIEPATRMNPDLQFAQSIQGVSKGRGIGIIDTLHLAEVALAIEVLRGSALLTAADDTALTAWFRDYLHWMRTHPNGIEEMKADNNHGTCWVLQVACFARLTRDEAVLAECRQRLREVLLPGQMAPDGGFPRELARTKPYAYSIFNLDVMSALAVVLSTPDDNLMARALPDGRSLVKGVEFLAPFLADKSKWTKPPDVMYWADWPVRQPALLFGALASGNESWLKLWQRLPADSAIEEIQRNFPVRFPTLWLRHLRPSTRPARVTVNFNADWRFTKSDPAGAPAPGFDDAPWATVSAPHTFNDTDTFDNWSLPGHRGEQEQWSGRTWYRKTFTAPAAWAGKKVFIEFEAVRQVAEVYLNGQLLGTAKGGFTPFGFDLTPHLKIGAPNVLAVMADNRFMKDPLDPSIAQQAATTAATHPNLSQLSKQLMEQIPATLEELQADQIPWNNPHWHPAHGGIYRNVRLIITDALHLTLPLYSFLQTEGPYAYATEVTEKSAKIGLEIPVRNERSSAADAEITAELFDANDKLVAALKFTESIAAGETKKIGTSIVIPQPRLWEPAYPHLYRVVLSLNVRNTNIDRVEIPLGIRSIWWDAQAGLFVNGAHLKLQGWGQKPTNEWPGLGAAQPDWMHYYTAQLMRDAGGNFIRWGHVPGGPAQIIAGDRLGIIALQPGGDGEHDTVGGAWALRVADFRDLLIYYRNNPSIFIWEGGNQKVTRDHAAELRGLMDRYDPHGGRAFAFRRADAITAEFMDVGIGTEGGREIARLPVVEGEYNREESPRRVWDDFSPPNFGYPEGKGQTYQLTSEQFAANQAGHYVKKLGAESHAGGANWIFSDSTSGGRVATEVARASGEVDGVRLPKEAYYVVAAMFRDDPQVHIIGHWTYPAGTKKDVFVASNAAEVELFLNGRSLGAGQVSDRYLFTFPQVTWAAGELKAVARTAGRVVAEQTRHTVGPAVALRLTARTGPEGWQADGADVALIDVEAVDAQGDRCPTFQQRVDFFFTDPGTWRGGYNSGKIDSINNPWLDLEAGINRVMVRAGRGPGIFTVTATSGGLRSGSLSLAAREFTGDQPAMPRPGLPAQAPARTVPARPAPAAQAAGPAMLGQFIQTLNYTAPNAAIVHVERDARDGRNAYVNIDSPFTALPGALVGADWVQADNRDALYSAVDLMELAVTGPTVVWIAHDNRLARPAWLTQQFEAVKMTISVAGQKMDIFRRFTRDNESLTLGANTENTNLTEGAMYLVFVNTAAR